MSVVKRYTDIEPQPIEADGAKSTTKRLILGTDDGVPTFSVRMFEVGPGGMTPFHAHDFEHEIFVLDGEGELVASGKTARIRGGTAILIPPGEEHTMKNHGASILRVLCMVPKEHE